MNESNDTNSREFQDVQGDKQVIAFQCQINGRTFIITTSRKIFEKSGNSYRECSEKDEETKFLAKYTQPAQSLDIDYGDNR